MKAALHTCIEETTVLPCRNEIKREYKPKMQCIRAQQKQKGVQRSALHCLSDLSIPNVGKYQVAVVHLQWYRIVLEAK